MFMLCVSADSCCVLLFCFLLFVVVECLLYTTTRAFFLGPIGKANWVFFVTFCYFLLVLVFV